MHESNGLNNVCKLFYELRKTADALISLHVKSEKHHSRLKRRSEKLNGKCDGDHFFEEVYNCSALNQQQLQTAKKHLKTAVSSKEQLDRFSNLRKLLLKRRQFMLAAELELYVIRGLNQYEINPIFGTSLRTVEYHAAALRGYYNNMDEIPTNSIRIAVREAMVVSEAVKTNIIPGLPENVQTVISADPADLMFNISKDDLNEYIDRLHPYTDSYDYAAITAENTLRKLSEATFDEIIKCQNVMKGISSFYGYLDKASDYITKYYKLYRTFIQNESRKSVDAKLYDHYITSTGKGYPDIAAECGVTVYKLRSVVDRYDKKYKQYYKDHHK